MIPTAPAPAISAVFFGTSPSPGILIWSGIYSSLYVFHSPYQQLDCAGQLEHCPAYPPDPHSNTPNATNDSRHDDKEMLGTDAHILDGL
jgi:hypothetical protein